MSHATCRLTISSVVEQVAGLPSAFGPRPAQSHPSLLSLLPDVRGFLVSHNRGSRYLHNATAQIVNINGEELQASHATGRALCLLWRREA